MNDMETLWEEKSLTKQKKNLPNNTGKGKEDITKKTESNLIRNDSPIIIEEKKWVRNCPVCNKELRYSVKGSLVSAIERGRPCMPCSRTGEGNPFYGKTHTNKNKQKQRNLRLGTHLSKETKQKLSTAMMGDRNPFYGKQHTIECKKRQSKERKGKNLGKDNHLVRWLNKSNDNRTQYCEKFKGNKNGMFGKHLTDATKKNLSLKNSGKGNPMYGKPTPTGAGGGWKCWYKNWFFRSLRELQYYITEIEDKNLKCENAQKLFSIPYKDYFNHDRTYRPDFLVENKYLIEIKPKKLWTTPLVLLKRKAAIKFCKIRGLKYRLVDVVLNFDMLKSKYLGGEITFMGIYKEKFEKYANINT